MSIVNLDPHGLTQGNARDQVHAVSQIEQTPIRRIIEQRWILVAVAVALTAITLVDAARPWHAAIAFLVILSVTMLAPTRSSEQPAEGGVAPEGAPGAPTIETFLAAIPNPVIILDNHLSVRFFNPAAHDLLPNLKMADPIAYAMRVPDVIDAVRAVAAGSGPRRVDYAERVPVDRAVEAQVTAVPGEDGAGPAYVLVVLRDVTQQTRVEAMRADFVANASHELRTPLASLSGFIETLQGPAKNDAPARERFLDIMRAQATRMSRLIDDLLSLSRIELNAHVRPDTPVDIVGIVAHVADTLAPLAKDRNVELTIERGAPTLEVLGERDELIRVFENLVENAIKYGASGGKVDITLAEAKRGIGRAAESVVTVRDYGPGIAAEHLPRLTERFYRVDVAQSRDKGGTGLGLAIVKHILARHRGRLVIESKLGEGAAFIVRIDRTA